MTKKVLTGGPPASLHSGSPDHCPSQGRRDELVVVQFRQVVHASSRQRSRAGRRRAAASHAWPGLGLRQSEGRRPERHANSIIAAIQATGVERLVFILPVCSHVEVTGMVGECSKEMNQRHAG